MVNWLSILRSWIFLHIGPISTNHEPLTEMNILPAQSTFYVFMHKGHTSGLKKSGNTNLAVRNIS